MKTQKLSQYAKDNSITYRAAWNRFKKGLISNAKKDELGNILIYLETEKPLGKRTIIYSRVSSSENKSNLKTQSERLSNFALNNGLEIIKIVEEVGSGMNDNRRKLNSIINLNDYDCILVEHKDRLTRFGFNFLEQLLKKDNKQIIVANKTEDKNTDLITDLISIVYSFSARLYSKRRSKNIKEKVETIIKEEV